MEDWTILSYSSPDSSRTMKAVMVVVLLIVVGVGAVAGFYFYSSFENSTSPVDSSCSDPRQIGSHIYNRSRLEIVKACITVSGTVELVRGEQDGDLHIRLNLDPAYGNLTNSANDNYQYGDLVAEIICVNTPTHTDAIPSCQNYTNRILIPAVGQHVTVTGPYVLDTEHYDWAEIHPVLSLKSG